MTTICPKCKGLWGNFLSNRERVYPEPINLITLVELCQFLSRCLDILNMVLLFQDVTRWKILKIVKDLEKGQKEIPRKPRILEIRQSLKWW